MQAPIKMGKEAQVSVNGPFTLHVARMPTRLHSVVELLQRGSNVVELLVPLGDLFRTVSQAHYSVRPVI